MRTPICLLVVAAALFILPAAPAQLPATPASRQVETFQQRNEFQPAFFATNVPALYPGETSDVGPQSVVEIKPRRTWIEAYADEQYFYTDNVLLADHNKQGANVLVSTIQAAVAPTPFAVCGGQLAPRLGFQQQWFNFGLADSGTVTVINPLTGTPQNVNLNTFDFSVSTVFADLTWRRNNWLLTLGADARWLLDSGNYNQFYREFVPRWTIEREFPLTQKTGLAIGYDGDYRDTQTQSPPAGVGENYNDRTDHSLYVVGSWRLCRYAVLQPFYRFEYSHYTRVSRDDFLNSFGLALYCPVTKNVTLRAFVGYDNLNTDGQFAQNYEMLDAGGGLNLFIRF